MESLNVMYLTDSNYAIFAGVSIISLFENNRDIDNINVYVIDDSIEESYKREYANIAKKYERNIIFLDVSEGIRILKQCGAPTYRGSYTTYLKLFAFNLLPDDVHQLFFIDSDSVVVGSLRDIINYDMKGYMLAAVKDGLCHSYKISMGYPAGDSWYNMGVVLVDVDKWKKEDGQGKILKQLEKRTAYVAVDQDLLNITQHGNILPLSPRYNATPHHYVYKEEDFQRYMPQEGFYNISELKEAQKDPVIRHFERFVGESPWHKNSIHPYTPLFDYYLSISPWRDYEKKKAKVSMKLKIEKILYILLPKKFFLKIWSIAFARYLENLNDKLKNNPYIQNIS